MYYDNTVVDNITYIGDYASLAGENVWDDSYSVVHHMGSSLTDSTGNGNNGTNSGSAVTSGILGDARYFDGVNDYVYINHSVLNPTNSILMLKNNMSSSGSNRRWLTTTNGNFTGETMCIREETAGNVQIFMSGYAPMFTLPSKNEYHLYYIRKNTASYNVAVDNSIMSSKEQSIPSLESKVFIGGYSSITNVEFFKGKVDEVRISTIYRADAWMSAEYNSLFDNLITYTVE